MVAGLPQALSAASTSTLLLHPTNCSPLARQRLIIALQKTPKKYGMD